MLGDKEESRALQTSVLPALEWFGPFSSQRNTVTLGVKKAPPIISKITLFLKEKQHINLLRALRLIKTCLPPSYSYSHQRKSENNHRIGKVPEGQVLDGDFVPVQH